MGWLAIVAIVPLVRSVPAGGLLWLLAGGILYTMGAVIYATRRPDPLPKVFGFHEIFHFFVLAGSTSHFVFMLRYVLPA
jgi:hemolysin III